MINENHKLWQVQEELRSKICHCFLFINRLIYLFYCDSSLRGLQKSTFHNLLKALFLIKR